MSSSAQGSAGHAVFDPVYDARTSLPFSLFACQLLLTISHLDDRQWITTRKRWRKRAKQCVPWFSVLGKCVQCRLETRAQIDAWGGIGELAAMITRAVNDWRERVCGFGRGTSTYHTVFVDYSTRMPRNPVVQPGLNTCESLFEQI